MLVFLYLLAIVAVLYFYKDLPFKASLYALYVVIAVFGYFKWRQMIGEEKAVKTVDS